MERFKISLIILVLLGLAFGSIEASDQLDSVALAPDVVIINEVYYDVAKDKEKNQIVSG